VEIGKYNVMLFYKGVFGRKRFFDLYYELRFLEELPFGAGDTRAGLDESVVRNPAPEPRALFDEDLVPPPGENVHRLGRKRDSILLNLPFFRNAYIHRELQNSI